MKQEEFNELFRKRTKKLALDIIKLVSPIKYSDAVGTMRKQLIDACTSVASNYRAACRARSQRERYSKLCIVVEEADETVFWLEMFVEAEFLTKAACALVYNEAEEILKVMSSFRKSIAPKS
jgi:four helix bundle protein